MAGETDGIKFEQRHGKTRVRVGRVWKRSDGSHSFVEWSVSVSLLSDCLPAYFNGDNSHIVATDTMKNTVYVKAKECSEQISMEDFAIGLGKHFTTFYQQVTASIIKIVEKPWERMIIDGQPHKHGFKLGSEKHTTEVIVKKSGALRVTSGIEGLALLKTTKSGFEGFIRDKYTILPETRERMLATEVTASWMYSLESLSSVPSKPFYFSERFLDVKKVLVDTFFGPPKEGVYSPSVQRTLYEMAEAVLGRFPDVSSIQLKMPNIHFLPVNLSNKENVIVQFKDDVYLPTDEPHGTIEASLSRVRSKISNGDASQHSKEESKKCTPIPNGNLKKKRSYAQLHLDLGQSDFLLHTCSVCGFMYACGDEGDEKVHKEFHKDYMHGIQFKGWNNERVVNLPSTTAGRVILVLDGDPPAHKKKVQKVVEMMEMDLGSECLIHKLYKVYLYILHQRIAGCLVAEPIKVAYRVLSNSEAPKSIKGTNANDNGSNSSTLQFGGINFQREAVKRAPSAINSVALEEKHTGAVFLTNEAVPAICGIRAIWVAPSVRRKQIASHLLDAVRMSFCEGFVLKSSQLAFSDPTSSGMALACSYFDTSSFLAYKSD
ncbi:hypothetical protein RHGRI_027318 [Rhododendron griersonianum]|uniref:factor independent urate hydroxylase n=1 Tax=Rhododendron griersonianum TaxID=479676 RepID=A0AAV6IVX2_9ERIC|nr:hypothetical protein RHGRI_027318 [Rhododendron griersonianum]